jgi:hypothetical protein
VAWDEFRVAFCGHHLLASTVHRRLIKFLELRQGNRSVYGYTQEFNNLAQYGGHHVDSDGKKTELYRKGLNIQLQDHLIQNLKLSYNDLASTAIDQEGTMKACEAVEEKKKKKTVLGPTRGSSSGAPPKYCMVYMPAMGQPHQSPQFWGNRHQFQQQFSYAPFTPQQQGAARPPQQVTPVGYPCYNYAKVWHFAKEYRLPRQTNSQHTPAPMATQQKS